METMSARESWKRLRERGESALAFEGNLFVAHLRASIGLPQEEILGWSFVVAVPVNNCTNAQTQKSSLT